MQDNSLQPQAYMGQVVDPSVRSYELPRPDGGFRRIEFNPNLKITVKLAKKLAEVAIQKGSIGDDKIMSMTLDVESVDIRQKEILVGYFWGCSDYDFSDLDLTDFYNLFEPIKETPGYQAYQQLKKDRREDKDS